MYMPPNGIHHSSKVIDLILIMMYKGMAGDKDYQNCYHSLPNPILLVHQNEYYIKELQLQFSCLLLMLKASTEKTIKSLVK